MFVFEGIWIALQQVWAHKLKSAFTLIGVIIGITFLIAVITVVEGMNRYVQEDFAGSLFGVNTFTVVRRSQISTGSETEERRRRQARNPVLTLHDVEVVRTAVPEAWRLAYSSDRGFDEVMRHGGGGVGQTPDFWDNAYFDGSYFHNSKPESVKGFCTDVWFDYAKKFIKSQKKAGKPFLTYIATNAPHGPMHAPPSFSKPYEKLGVGTANFFGSLFDVTGCW